jgi:hypothetical protein
MDQPKNESPKSQEISKKFCSVCGGKMIKGRVYAYDTITGESLYEYWCENMPNESPSFFCDDKRHDSYYPDDGKYSFFRKPYTGYYMSDI